MHKPLYILHIEDDPDDAELLHSAFKDKGISCHIIVVSEGNKVMPWLDQQEDLPQIILMDLNLPKMHGKEILLKIKENKRFSEIPLLVLTTSSSKEDIEYCLHHGANEFMTKPTTWEGFEHTVVLIVGFANKSAH